MKKKKKKTRPKGSGRNPTSLEVFLRGRVVKLEAENKLLNNEASLVLEELWERVETLEKQVKELRGDVE